MVLTDLAGSEHREAHAGFLLRPRHPGRRRPSEPRTLFGAGLRGNKGDITDVVFNQIFNRLTRRFQISLRFIWTTTWKMCFNF